MSVRILVVEDETDIRDLILLHLKREGYAPDGVATGEDALDRLKNQAYQLIVLDWMLPTMSGLEILKKIRNAGASANSTPVLMVTARAEPADIVEGLEAGADDYLTKPFDFSVLLARVRAILRRSHEKSSVLQFGALRIDLDAHDVFIAEERIHLTPSEYKLLQALAENRGRVLTRKHLIQLVQGDGITVVDRAVDTQVFGLRKKLGIHDDIIETIRSVGYRIKSI